MDNVYKLTSKDAATLDDLQSSISKAIAAIEAALREGN